MLESARAYVLGQFPLQLETAAHWAAALADLEFYGLGKDYIEGYGPALAKVDLAETAAVTADAFPRPARSRHRADRRRGEDPRDRAKYGTVTEMKISRSGLRAGAEVTDVDHGSSAKAILYAFVANLGIALAKLAASIYTHSGSMLAEAIHSFADCGNQVLLFIGLKQSQKPPDAKHPLGYGKITYFWSFVVALLLFSMGGLFSIYEGWHKLSAHEPLNKAWVALLVLGVSIGLEFGSLWAACARSTKLRKGKSLRYWVKHTRNAELVVVLGEDLAALVGLVLAFVFVALAAVTGNPMFDAIGSIVIGVVLVCVSIFIAIRIKGLIVGRSAEDDLQEAMRAEIAGDPDIHSTAERHHHADGAGRDARAEGAHARRAHARGRRRGAERARAAHQGASFPKSPGASSSPTSPTKWGHSSSS